MTPRILSPGWPWAFCCKAGGRLAKIRSVAAGGRAGSSRWWRGALAVALASLVYYISYDHGRDSFRPRLEERERLAQTELERLRGEIVRLQTQLSVCLAPDGQDRAAARIPLKINQSKTLFDGRLVVSVLALDSEAGWARVQLNFVEEARRTAEDLAVGGSRRFSFARREWAVVLDSLTLTTANLHLREINANR